MSSKIDEIITAIENLTVLDSIKLVKMCEEKWGVSSTAVAATATTAPVTQEEEKTEFEMVLKSFDATKKLAAIKALRVLFPNLELAAAKSAIESIANAPYPIGTINITDRDKIIQDFEAAGVKAEVVK